MIRDILDYQGNVVGQLELPDTTSEERWAEVLAPYAVVPPTTAEKLDIAISRSVAESRLWADEIIEKFKKYNLSRFMQLGLTDQEALMKSLWVHHRLRAVTVNLGLGDRVIDLLNLCISGDLETAFIVLKYMQPDDMSQPDHYLSAEVIAFIRDLVGEKTGQS